MTLAWLVSFLLAVAAGTAVDVGGVSGDRALMAPIALTAAVVFTAWGLRTLSPREPILRYGVGLMLALSLIAAVLTAVGASSLAPSLICGGVGLAGFAILVQAEASDRPGILSQIAFYGSAATVVSWADLDFDQSLLIPLIGLGLLTLAGMVVAELGGSKAPESIGHVGVGVLVVGGGVALLADRQLPGMIVVIIGLAYVGSNVTELVGRTLSGWIALALFGVMAATTGVIDLVGRQLPIGMAFLGAGAALAGYGLSAFREDHAIFEPKKPSGA
jgi:hypothetical protein